MTLVLSLALLGAVCQSQAQVQSVAVAQQAAVVQTAFAIPIATPVATVANPSLFYSYNAYSPVYNENQAQGSVYSQSFEDRLATKIAARLGASLEGAGIRAKAFSLVDQHCAKCHSGDDAKAGFRVDVPLSEAARLKSITRVLADDTGSRMPKGEPLDAREIGKLIQELSRHQPIGTVKPEPTDEAPPPPLK